MPTAPAPDPAPGPLTMVKLRERHGDLMSAYGEFENEPTPEFLDRIIAFQIAASAAGADISSSDERFEAQAKINYWQTARINAGQRPDTVLLAAFDQDAAKREARGRSPYKGLAPFVKGDAKFFSGRYAVVGALVDKVKTLRLLALVGLSGSGKSSVVRAGLIPALAQGAYDGINDNGLTDSSQWDYPDPILPGADPLAALVARYGPITVAADLPAALDRTGKPVLLSIDQFEEVFTLSPEGDRRTLFLDALVAAATTGVHRHVVVITMRSEFDTFVESHPAFSALFKIPPAISPMVIQTMEASDLRKAIEEPAYRLGVGFEPGLVDELMTKLQGEPAGLPLLSFTLLKLWEMRAGGSMTWADYKSLGNNPRTILANSADKVFEDLLPEDQTRAKGVFTRLVEIGDKLDATSKRITRDRLDVLGARDNVNRVLDTLVTEGLLRTSPARPDDAGSGDRAPGWWITPDTWIEVAHEALIRNWGRLSQWVKDELGQQTNRKAFTLRAEAWADRGGDLLTGLSLDEARKFHEKSPVEERFVVASIIASRRRQRQVMAAFTVMGVLIILTSVLAFRLLMIGRDREAHRRSDTLFAVAETLVDRGDESLARKVLLESVDAAEPLPVPVQAVARLLHKALPGSAAADEPLPPRVQALLQSVALNGLSERSVLRIAGKRPTDVMIDDSGTALLSLWDDGIARAWIQGEGDKDFVNAPLILAVPGRRISAIALSPDGSSAVSASTDSFTQSFIDFWTFDAADSAAPARRVSKKYQQHWGETKSIKYFPNDPDKQSSARVMLATGVGSVVEIDTKTKDLRNETNVSNVGLLNGAAYAPGGDKILATQDDGSVVVLDATTHEPNPRLANVETIKNSATRGVFNPTGERFAIGSNDGIVRVYRTSDNQKLYDLVGHRQAITGLAFAPDGATLVSSSKDGTLRFWDSGVETGRLRRTLPINVATGGGVSSVAFAADGERIVVAVNDGSIRILDVTGNKLKTSVPIGTATDYYRSAIWAISADHSTVITNTDVGDGTVRATQSHYELFDLKTGKRRSDWIEADAGQFYAPQLSADGSLLAFITDTSDGFAVRARAMAPGTDAVTVGTMEDFPPHVAVAPDGKTIIIVDVDGRITAHDRNDWPKARALMPFGLDASDYPQLVSRFSANGRLFALTQSNNLRTYVYDLATGKIIATIRSASAVSALQFSPDGKTLFIGTDAGSGAIYDARSGTRRNRLGGSHDGGISIARFSGNGKTLVTGSTDAAARLWDTGTGEKLQVLRGHTATLSGARFSGSGDRLLTESDDSTVRLWDTATGRQLTVLRGVASSGALYGWFADGDTVQTVSASPSELRTWKVKVPTYSYGDLRSLACQDHGGIITPDERERNSLPPTTASPECTAVTAAK